MYKCVDDYFYEDDSPKRCTRCQSIDIIERIAASSEGVVWETSFHCIKCGESVGYQVQTHFDPVYRKMFLQRHPQNDLLNSVIEAVKK